MVETSEAGADRFSWEPPAVGSEPSEANQPPADLVASGDSPTPPAEAGDLLPLVYQSLKELARQRMAMERPGHTLQATALVHEVYLRLTAAKNFRFAGRAQFYHAAAEAMRRILIDHARARGRAKRGAGARRMPINLLDLAEKADRDQILALDDAIRRLETHTPQIAAVVRLRFFAGLTVEETAEALAIGRRSVDRAWAYARVWLGRELYERDPFDGPAPQD
jgi:RNA polymerase sigma factor (TIGR02999 family)